MILRRLIWVYTVCLGPKNGTLGQYGLRVFNNGWHLNTQISVSSPCHGAAIWTYFTFVFMSSYMGGLFRNFVQILTSEPRAFQIIIKGTKTIVVSRQRIILANSQSIIILCWFSQRLISRYHILVFQFVLLSCFDIIKALCSIKIDCHDLSLRFQWSKQHCQPQLYWDDYRSKLLVSY